MNDLNMAERLQAQFEAAAGDWAPLLVILALMLGAAAHGVANQQHEKRR